VELEKRGIPTISICTDEFAPLGRMEAKTLRMPHLSIVTIPHPLGGLKPEEVVAKSEIAFQAIANLFGKG
jgi:hypothetical protein